MDNVHFAPESGTKIMPPDSLTSIGHYASSYSNLAWRQAGKMQYPDCAGRK
jgi:hypothetical protein